MDAYFKITFFTRANDGQNAFIQWTNGNKENYTVVSFMKPAQYIGNTVKTDQFWSGMVKDIAVHMAWKVTEGKSRLTRKSIENFQTISYCFPYEDDFIDDDFVDGSMIEWYGISRIPELGFKSKELLLVADRIGGGAASMCTLTEGMKRLDIENQLIKLMKDSASIRGISIEKESMLVMKR